ncbi:phage tail protein [Aeromonas tecta]|uniref:phage tail protein n=1 Tax=Aeromonas tecta TaxID=324617 RepID=UPI0006823859|nr:phage tail protein [Aeromonas tecta]
MYWLDNDSGVTTPPAIPPVVSGTRQYFTEGGAGDQPSIPGGEWFNMMTDELLQVLTLGGITPDKADHTQLAKAIQTIAFSAYPVGAPIPWPSAIVPSGYAKFNGGSFSLGANPRLAALYPSGVLPDMRGLHIRGLDDGKGHDPGRSLLSYQADQNKAHSHFFENTFGAPTGTFNSIDGRIGTISPQPIASSAAHVGSVPVSGAASFSAIIASQGGTESTVKNMAFLWITKLG